MKTVSITLDDATYEEVRRLAQAQGKAEAELLAGSVTRLVARQTQQPDYDQRRRVLDTLWDRIDVCNVEVGERPSRARTYDYRRFHRY